ncbi:MAG TPA: methyltransferase domain-containing protein [Pseudonocardia sp.]|nr:methyltransferase domain-containing protein [Pseudonocardia sp.]
MLTSSAGRVPHSSKYLDRIAGTSGGQEYKRQALAALDLQPGQAVLDMGCGPGTDLPALAEAVTSTGSVIGVDHAETFVAEARERVADLPWVQVRAGDAHQLPLQDNSVDRARADRVIQHVADPAAAVAEFRRVLRPGGLAVLAEPDWDTLAISPGDLEANRAFNRFVCAVRVRNAIVGRQLAGLAEGAGLEVLEVFASTPLLRDFRTASKIYGLNRNTERAVEAGYLDRSDAQRWVADLKAGPFLATCTVYVALLRHAG